MRRITGALLLVATVLAGCISSPADVTGDIEAPDVTSALASKDALWEAPHKFPHPAFDHPTLTNPPAASTNPWLEPVEVTELPEEITGVQHETNIGGDAGRGAGIALVGSLAIVPSWVGTTTVFDISDPAEPERLSVLDPEGAEPVPARDADTIVTPDGRIVAVFATDDDVVPVWDLTDPTEPARLGLLHPEDGSHNVDVVPGTPILYNANSQGGKAQTANLDPAMGQGITEIYDLSWSKLQAGVVSGDLDEATLVQNWDNGYGCHDITFHITESRQRAYCAGIEYTQIWDVTDPIAPEVVVNVPVHHGMADQPALSEATVRFSHLAMVDQAGDTLIVGDETGGGVSPGCDAYAHAGGRTVSGPIGNLYFYDISDETDPQLEGWVSPSQHYPTNPPHDDDWTPYGPGELPPGCTAHFGHIVPSQDRDLLAIAFYGAGVTLVDFTDPADPVIVEQWAEDTNVWDVWYYNGWLVTGDLARGMDVFTLAG